MKVIDKNGRFFGKISFIDIIVIIVVILLAAGIYLRFFALETTASVGQPSSGISYELKVPGVRSFTVDAIKPGDKIFSTDGSIEMGTITGVRTEPATYWGFTLDGTAAKCQIEGKYDLFLTVDAEGLITNNRFYISRVAELESNFSQPFVTKYASSTGTVTEINPA